jgi:hypothetical protein
MMATEACVLPQQLGKPLHASQQSQVTHQQHTFKSSIMCWAVAASRIQ